MRWQIADFVFDENTKLLSKQFDSKLLKPNITPLTRLAGMPHQPDLTHDGRRLVMSRYLENDNDSLILIDVDEQIPNKISQNGGSGNHAKWSYDDSFIIYLYRNKIHVNFTRLTLLTIRHNQPKQYINAQGLIFLNLPLKHTSLIFTFCVKCRVIRPTPYFANRGVKWIQKYGVSDIDNALMHFLKKSHPFVSFELTKKMQKKLGLNQSECDE